MSREVVRLLREGRIEEAARAQGLSKRAPGRTPVPAGASKRERELMGLLNEMDGKLARAAEALDAAVFVISGLTAEEIKRNGH